MTTYSQAPIHFFASTKAFVAVKATLEFNGDFKRGGKNTYLVVLSAETDLELPFAFLNGYRIRPAYDLGPDLCTSDYSSK